jgi:hypothetical protein
MGAIIDYMKSDECKISSSDVRIEASIGKVFEVAFYKFKQIAGDLKLHCGNSLMFKDQLLTVLKYQQTVNTIIEALVSIISGSNAFEGVEVNYITDFNIQILTISQTYIGKLMY